MDYKAYNKSSDWGLLLLRTGLGLSFIAHGYPKLLAGPPAWERLGTTMSIVGIDSYPLAWGLAAAVSETLGGILLICGIFTALTCSMLTITMAMATAFHLNKGDSFNTYSHPLELMLVFMSLLLIGPGRISLDGLRFSPLKAASKRNSTIKLETPSSLDEEQSFTL